MKALIGLVLFILMFGFGAFAQQGESYTQVIRAVTASPVEPSMEPLGGSKDTLYRVEMSGLRFPAITFASELEPILKMLKLKKPEDLNNLTFVSLEEDPEEAFDRLRLIAVHNGQYIPPSTEQFFSDLAKGIASLNCPNTRNMADDDTVFRILRTAIKEGCSSLKPEFFESFSKKIRDFSNGTMSIEMATSNEIGGISSSCGGNYLVAKQNNRYVAKFEISGASNGFMCTTDVSQIAEARMQNRPTIASAPQEKLKEVSAPQFDLGVLHKRNKGGSQ